MKLSDLLGTSTVRVPAGAHAIEVTYLVSQRTILAGRKLPDENVAQTIVRIVESWDLQEADGTTVPLTVERLETIPIPILGRIIAAIFEDDPLGEAPASSDAG